MKRWPETEDGGGAVTRTGAAAPAAVEAAPVGLPVVLALVAAGVAAVALLGPLLGIRASAPVLAVIALGAVAVHLLPDHPFEVTALAGLWALAGANPPYALYHAALIGLLFVARRRTWALALTLGLLAIWLPKHLFAAHYHHPSTYRWLNEPSLVLVLFASACWWRARRDGRLPPSAEEASPLGWTVMYLFPGHVVNPMVFSPGDVFRARRFDVRAIGVALLLIAVKAAAHTAIGRHLGQFGYAGLDAARMAGLSRVALWAVVAVGYLDLVLTLSGTADIAVLLARLYGWPMPSPFRFALLAWNPIELWRRWGIYNRKVLLSLVYFPLGGNRRHRLRNVMLTFLASALLLHSGWFGSKYWEVGPGGWRDQTVYFLVQGLLVCGCLLVRDARGAGARSDDRALRWGWGRAAGTAATQATSALVHVIVLARELPFADRFGMIARCLGAP
ncbi:MAG TPA: hypothetical protein VHO06_18105 [Polyangia bacterium]|nr:hypothetical protein [Polyangia bacterium]